MSKILSIVFIGALLALIPFFFFFIGLKIHFIDPHQIKEYYNAIFFYNMPWEMCGYLGLVLGILFVLPKSLYYGAFVFLAVLGASLTMFIPSVVDDVSHELFIKKSFHIKKGKHLYKGTLLYEGQDHYYFVKDDTNRTITFKKEEVDETY